MGTEIANVSNAAAAAMMAATADDLRHLQKAVQHADADRAPIPGSKPFLRMQKDGSWVFGSENIEVQDNSLWMIDPASYMRGFVCWTRYPEAENKDNELLGEVLVPLSGTRPNKADLPEYIWEKTGQPWEWADAASIELVCLTGDDAGLRVLYKTNSHGGMSMLDEYFRELKLRMTDGHDEFGHVYATGKLDSTSYKHPKWGKTYKPEFAYEEWLAPPSADRDLPPAEDEAPEVVDEAPSDEAPRRSRRRPAA